MDKKELKGMYIKGWEVVGKLNHLLPTWDIMVRIFRETVHPKGGKFDEIHLYEVDLLVNARKMQGKGIKLDIMDYIYHEMWTATMERKLPPFAPYIMMLIESTWEATKGTALTASVPVSFIDQEKKKLRVKTH